MSMRLMRLNPVKAVNASLDGSAKEAVLLK
ncbi:MAG: hypothetical protein RIS84_826 [Pseudomonadota bacterium]|jgi:hypothetical protein